MAQSLSRSARSRSQAVTAKKMKKAATAATTNEVTHIAPQERCALVLQGGGALGAYQGGVYEQLAAHGVLPDWVAGISIGAINAALIAGNQRGIDGTDRNARHPIRQYPMGSQLFIYTALIGSQRTATLQHQGTAFLRGNMCHFIRGCGRCSLFHLFRRNRL